jgi:glycosyltransferase involved in cell wall biosynthesis
MYLPDVLEQDYPEFEVVVVNDASDDDSSELLKDFSIKYPHLKVVNFARNLNFFRGKKFPLSLGIKSATHDILLFTDADCRPAGKNWISMMSSRFNERVDIVLGYGPYERTKGLLNAMIRYDTFHVAMQYLSFSLMGLTYMGVGRNLAYRKSLFYKHKGFTSHYKIASGDDDLFINRAANKRNTKVEISPESFTISRPVKGWFRFIRQKKRHLTTAKYYKWKFKFLLTAYSVSQFFAWILFFTLIFSKFNLLYVLMLMGVKLISQFIVTYFCSIQLKEEKLLLFSPLIELLFVILNPLIAISNLIYKTDKWK